MLTELRIRNVAIIDQVTLAIAPGFNVLSGETGAGKSIIVGALGLLLGERGHADVIRSGQERASVEGVFEVEGEPGGVLNFLDERGIERDGAQVVLKRELSANGRSRAWINGSTVTAAQLAEVGRRLVDLHGQHDAQALLEADVQLRVLDAFGQNDRLVEAVRAGHQQLQLAIAERKDLAARRADAERRADYLRHVTAEIAEARLQPGEDARIEDEVRRLSHVEELRRHAAQLCEGLEGDDETVLRRLSVLRKSLAAAERLDPSLARLSELLEGALDSLTELAREVRAYEEGLDADPERLAELERRRDVLFRMTSKYGGSIDRALELLRSSQAELDLVDTAAIDLSSMAAREGELRATLVQRASELTEARRRSATRLGRAVTRLLPELGMTAGRFDAVLVPLSEIGPSGAEGAELRVTLNVGHEARALARVASGGELSRVMLALKTVLAQLDRTPTLVFDEVDAGIGGAVALHVGDAMRKLAAHHQVVAITHLAQIAARAHRHVTVRKEARGGVTTADISVVEGDARVEEISRMLGGDTGSAASRAHAQELLQLAVRGD